MKVHFFEMSIENADETPIALIDRIGALPLAQRDKNVNGKYMFLETVEAAGPQDNMRELDFTQRRVQNGPGHSQRGQLTTDFDLGEGSGFGEQTAAILSNDSYLAVQYNHYGVRPSAIATYLGQFLSRGVFVSLVPVLDDDAYARLQRSQKKMRLEFAINASEITPEMADQVGLAEALNLQSETEAGHISIALSLGQDRRGGPLRNVTELVSRIRHSPGLTTLKAAVKSEDEVGAVTEVLDLLKQRETVDIPDHLLRMTNGLRFTYESRMDALRQVFGPWLQQR